MVTNLDPSDGMDADFDKIKQSTRLVAALQHLPRIQLVISIPATTAVPAIAQATPLPEIDPAWLAQVGSGLVFIKLSPCNKCLTIRIDRLICSPYKGDGS